MINPSKPGNLKLVVHTLVIAVPKLLIRHVTRIEQPMREAEAIVESFLNVVAQRFCMFLFAFGFRGPMDVVADVRAPLASINRRLPRLGIRLDDRLASPLEQSDKALLGFHFRSFIILSSSDTGSFALPRSSCCK